MRKEYQRRLLERAATVSIERIREDGKKAPAKIRTLFPYIEEHLFRKYLDVSRMRRDCGKHDHSISTFFCSATGKTPHAYIIERRIETAAALLRDTDLKGWTISDLVGFSNHATLTRNFSHWCGIPPRAFRSGVKKIFARAGGRPRNVVPGVEEFRGVLAIGMDSQAADRLIEHIRSTIANERRTETETREDNYPLVKMQILSPSDISHLRTVEIWAMLQEKTWPEQRELMRNRLTFSNPAFFHYVREQSILEGVKDPMAGVHFAKLAKDSLGAIKGISDSKLLRLQSQAWAWIGNALRLALDFPGAEQAFRLAEEHLPTIEEMEPVHGEFCHLKSAFRWWQNRPSEALDLIRDALPTIRATGNKKQLAEALILMSAILTSLNNIEKGLPCLREAERVIDGEEEPFIEFAAKYNLATAMAKLGLYAEARRIIPDVAKLSDDVNSQSAQCHVQWLEGVISRGLDDMESAETQLLAAREGFDNLSHAGHVAIVTLDLAELYAKQQRSTEVQQLTLEVIPILEGLQHCREAMSCFRLLSEAVEKNTLRTGTIIEARESLEHARVNPSAGFSLARSREGEPVLPRFSE